MASLSVKIIDSLRRIPIAGGTAEKFGDILDFSACRNEYVSGAMLIEVEVESEVEVSYTGLGDAAIMRAVDLPIREAGARLVDPLLEESRFTVSGSQGIWVRLHVPKDASTGTHAGWIVVKSGEERAEVEVRLQVNEICLPDPWDGDFFLNVWMNPGAIARWYDVPLWSEEHWSLLDKYVADLAAHGQKTVVAPVVFDPWCSQTYTPYPSTVEWIKDASGWRMDFTCFDRYVELHAKHGIRRAIHCYSPVHSPGDSHESTILHRDADGEERRLTVEVGSDEYREAWGAFARQLVGHIREKGWLDRTYIAFDEKPSEVMIAVFDLLRDVAPELKIALAANVPQRLYDSLDDVSLIMDLDEGGIQSVKARREAGKLTTFYVCCGPAFPNTFVFSPPVEGRMLPWIAWDRGFDGFLRWAYSDWSPNPYEHPEWREWGTGDSFFVYPGEGGVVTTTRWELLREGIQEFEMLSILRRKIGLLSPDESAAALSELEDAVALAARNPDGKVKDVEDLRSARKGIFHLMEQVEESLRSAL